MLSKLHLHMLPFYIAAGKGAAQLSLKPYKKDNNQSQFSAGLGTFDLGSEVKRTGLVQPAEEVEEMPQEEPDNNLPIP